MNKWYWDKGLLINRMDLSNNSRLEIYVDITDKFNPYILVKRWFNMINGNIQVRYLGRYETFKKLNDQVDAWLGGC